jgi:hypothetical protein
MDKIRFLPLIIFAFFSSHSHAQPNLIFDTDFGGDADDLGALAMLNHFENRKECNLLAVMVWSTEEYAVPAVDAVNHFYGNPDIPIGVRKDEKYVGEWTYSKSIADVFEHTETFESAPEATSLYRKILSKSKNKSIVIVAVGPLKNIEKLLHSKADSLSPLSGKELIESKVKEFVIMGGQFPEGEKEWNFDGNMAGVTKYVISNLNVPITFLGYELGVEIKTGAVFNTIDPNTPLYVGFMYFSQHAPWVKENFVGKILDNSTFDQTAVLYAVRNGVGTFWSRVRGTCIPDDHGGNTWSSSDHRDHAYLKLMISNQDMEEIIEPLMLGTF